ncbi:MAG: type II toxin-antitoxin system HicB family antitoxin [Sphingobacteriaceae bacterium]|nr:MAG: type II toxin-antitoxin system HicB family antitoxin [Sphingobacteriaceae bacterium]
MKKRVELDVDFIGGAGPLTKEEGDGYLVEFPDLPSCIAYGRAPSTCLEMIQKQYHPLKF